MISSDSSDSSDSDESGNSGEIGESSEITDSIDSVNEIDPSSTSFGSGKGDGRRPSRISRDKYGELWDKIFGEGNQSKEVIKKNKNIKEN